MKIICRKCDAYVDSDDLFCSKCGTKIETNVYLDSIHDDELEDKNLNKGKKYIILSVVISCVIVFILAVSFALIIKDGSSDNADKVSTNEQVSVVKSNEVDKSITLSEYVSKFKLCVRDTVDNADISVGVSDEKYINCAKTLINKMLKNPSTAQYNNYSVYEKDDYGKAIVYLDVSAQNGFGGWNRTDYYVCILSVDSNGKFTYSPRLSYVTDYNLLTLLKSINDFDEHPADAKVGDLIMNEEDLLYMGAQTNSSDIKMDCYKKDFDGATQYIYVDADSKIVKSVLLKFYRADSAEKIEKLCVAMSAALSGENNEVAKESAAVVLNFTQMAPFSSTPYYKDGFLYGCREKQGSMFYEVTAVTQEDYNKGSYWSPGNDETASAVVLDDIEGESYKEEEKIILKNYAGYKDSRLIEIEMEKLGLKCSFEEEFSDSVPKGYTIRQNPEAGTAVSKGDAITFYVSKGKQKVVANSNEYSNNNEITNNSMVESPTAKKKSTMLTLYGPKDKESSVVKVTVNGKQVYSKTLEKGQSDVVKLEGTSDSVEVEIFYDDVLAGSNTVKLH